MILNLTGDVLVKVVPVAIQMIWGDIESTLQYVGEILQSHQAENC